MENDGTAVKVADLSTQLPIPETSYLQEVTYNELTELRNNSNLNPGLYYRITDYQTTTTYERTTSAGHQFDVIVLALDEKKLSEDAYAIEHDGEDYFGSNKLSAWRLKYCLDNDIIRFAWARDEGFGVIYYMKDEFGNEAPYDFKNIKFQRYRTASQPILTGVSDEAIWASGLYAGFSPVNDDIHGLHVTFDEMDYIECYTFTNSEDYSDASLSGISSDNSIKEYIRDSTINQIGLNNIVIYGNTANQSKNNFLEIGCREITIFEGCSNNSFLNDCRRIIIGGPTSDNNSFGKNNHDIIMGPESKENMFGTRCFKINMGENCYRNEFGCSVKNIIMGPVCYSNKFKCDAGSDVSGREIKIGRYCYYNTFGSFCHTMDIGTAITTTDGNCRYNIFEERAHNIILGITCYSNKFGLITTNVTLGENCYSNTFGNDTGSTNSPVVLGYKCKDNIFGNRVIGVTFGEQCNGNVISSLCYDLVLGDNCVYNEFAAGANTCTFGNKCDGNRVGANCVSLSLSNRCCYNTFANECTNITFNALSTDDANSWYNDFGTFCQDITLGTECNYNKIGGNNTNYTLGNNCRAWQTGNYCRYIYAGNNCRNITLGTSVQHIIFGSSTSSKLNWVMYVTIESGAQYIKFTTSGTASSSNLLKNIYCRGCVVGTSSTYKTCNITRNNSFQTIVKTSNDVYTNP